MLAVVPKSPKTPQKEPQNDKPVPANPGHVQTAFRLPNELLEGLDALVGRANEHRPWPKLTRSELVRLLLTKAVEEPPDWLVPADDGRSPEPGRGRPLDPPLDLVKEGLKRGIAERKRKAESGEREAEEKRARPAKEPR